MADSEKAFKMFNRMKVFIVEVASLVFVALVVAVVAHELAFLLLWHW
jgi:hypothetical protein